MTELKNLMISVSGVRGIVGDGLTPDVVLAFAQAYGSEVGPGRIVVGRDSRVTGEMVKNAVWAGLMSAGCDVLDVGICPTPTTELVTEHPDNIGGIIITASHNPREWNALKLLARNGLFLTAEAGEKIIKRVNESDFHFAHWDKIGKVYPYNTAIEEHIKKILALKVIDAEKIRNKKFKVVADCCNGAGGTILPQLFEALGCEVVFLNPEPNGLFPRSPEPIPENLGELCLAVKEHNADLGIAVDPDVDRLALVSDEGQPLGEEFTLACVTRFVLSKTPGDVVVNASTTRVIDDLAQTAGVKCHRTKVGEINVAVKALEINAVIAGEGNGGVMYPEIHVGRDAPVGIALVLQYLAESNLKISELARQFPQYSMIKDKITLPFDVDAKAVVEQLKDSHAADNLDLIDGVKVLYDNSWIHIRASNTEPIIRIIAEAPSREETAALVKKFKSEVMDLQ
ncbi:phosphoglucosamine mutase [candidate division KSB1 bacterium]|nr:phosphoglucosamine mutase [candidate division KSB1 bacterium]